MKRGTGLLLAVPLLLAFRPPEPFELKEGDRVAFIGNAFFERDLQHNYLETQLTSRFKDRNVVFRNFGWSGDTVFGHGRASFGTPEDGTRRLLRDVGLLKPSVIFLAYGMNESFAGEKGLTRFGDGLNRLLESLSGTGARIILISPIRHERLGAPLPDPSDHNLSLERYVAAMKRTAESRGLRFIDLFPPEPGAGPMTDNGIHLNAAGYRRAADAVEAGLGLPPARWRVELHVNGTIKAEGTRISAFEASPESVRFTASDDVLARVPRVLVVRGLRPGRYALPGATSATAEEWAKGVRLPRNPRSDPFEALRATIAEKNRIFFDQWRPHNTTYIFGFRRREQGHLQPEFPLFPPIVTRVEARIAKLRAPKPVSYVLERAR